VTGELVRHPPSVTLIALVDGDLLCVRQRRPGALGWMLELPAGTLLDGETPEQAALRELREECGWTAAGFRELGSFWAAPAYSTELVHVGEVVRPRPHPDGASPDEDEQIEVELRPLEELPGCLTDAVSIAAFTLWKGKHEVRREAPRSGGPEG
jgi:ADP-ribose pyrophosphatase